MTYIVERLAERFPPQLVDEFERLPGFRNVLLHEYVGFDLDRAVEALDRLDAIRDFLEIVRSSVAEQ